MDLVRGNDTEVVEGKFLCFVGGLTYNGRLPGFVLSRRNRLASPWSARRASLSFDRCEDG